MGSASRAPGRRPRTLSPPTVAPRLWLGRGLAADGPPVHRVLGTAPRPDLLPRWGVPAGWMKPLGVSRLLRPPAWPRSAPHSPAPAAPPALRGVHVASESRSPRGAASALAAGGEACPVLEVAHPPHRCSLRAAAAHPPSSCPCRGRLGPRSPFRAAKPSSNEISPHCQPWGQTDVRPQFSQAEGLRPCGQPPPPPPGPWACGPSQDGVQSEPGIQGSSQPSPGPVGPPQTPLLLVQTE